MKQSVEKAEPVDQFIPIEEVARRLLDISNLTGKTLLEMSGNRVRH
jgi:hypothetical protein